MSGLLNFVGLMPVTPILWVTPGLQAVQNLSFNPGVNTHCIPDIKFRLSF